MWRFIGFLLSKSYALCQLGVSLHDVRVELVIRCASNQAVRVGLGLGLELFDCSCWFLKAITVFYGGAEERMVRNIYLIAK